MFLYDESGIIGMEYTLNGSKNTYYFHRNLLGDVLGIYNTSGTLVAKYLYDAWGNCTISGETTNYAVANANPIRYRSYYYDDDTGLYYCNARYYSPKWHRFISPDDTSYLNPETVNGLNQYCYCNNDPVNYADPSGHFGFWALAAITLGAMIIGGSAQLASNAIAGETGSDLWRGVPGAALGSGVNALALCLALPTGGASLFIGAGAGALVQTGVDTVETAIRGEDINWWQTAVDLGLNFATTLAGNYMGTKIIPTNAGWFQPKRFISVFLRPYGQKILMQTLVGAALSAAVNYVKKTDWDVVPMIIAPTI